MFRVRWLILLLGLLVSGCRGEVAGSGAPSLVLSASSIEPNELVSIQVVGAGPVGSEIEVRGSAEIDGAVVESFGVFDVNSDTVDLTNQRPVRGSYDLVDPMGLFWSLAETADGGVDNVGSRSIVSAEVFDEQEVALALLVDGEVVDSQVVVLDPAPGVEIVAGTVDPEEGFAVALLADPRRCPCPTLVMFSGSNGGMRAQPGGALASRGFAVALVAYFGLDELPSTLSGIDVGMITPALDWVLAQEMAAEPVAVLGGSRGSELATETAVFDNRIQAAVLIAPSSVRWGDLTGTGPAWALDDEPLPYIDARGTPDFRDGAIVWRTVFDATLDGLTLDSDSAFLPVEELNIPVLLISGDDDRLWPADRMADQIVVRRCESRPRLAETVNAVYVGAGHWFSEPPPWPIAQPAYGHDSVVTAAGGTRAANAAASRQSWSTMLGFLDHHLRDGGRETYPAASC